MLDKGLGGGWVLSFPDPRRWRRLARWRRLTRWKGLERKEGLEGEKEGEKQETRPERKR